jgi:hypothetical protein
MDGKRAMRLHGNTRLALRHPGTDSTLKRLTPPGYIPPTFDTALSRSQQQLSSDPRPALQRPETRSGAVICTDDQEAETSTTTKAGKISK